MAYYLLKYKKVNFVVYTTKTNYIVSRTIQCNVLEIQFKIVWVFIYKSKESAHFISTHLCVLNK